MAEKRRVRAKRQRCLCVSAPLAAVVRSEPQPQPQPWRAAAAADIRAPPPDDIQHGRRHDVSFRIPYGSTSRHAALGRTPRAAAAPPHPPPGGAPRPPKTAAPVDPRPFSLIEARSEQPLPPSRLRSSFRRAFARTDDAAVAHPPDHRFGFGFYLPSTNVRLAEQSHSSSLPMRFLYESFMVRFIRISISIKTFFGHKQI